MSSRYAIYYAPEHQSELARFGRQWLGRCAETGDSIEQPELSIINREAVSTITGTPRHYGFHGTLVPPFRLREPLLAEDLYMHAAQFAKGCASFDLPPLSVKEIGNFIALVPSDQDGVAALAAACVRSFRPLREDPTLAEMEQRRARGLTPVQERLMMRWGYPYVMEEFRFHLTLSGPVRDTKTRRKLIGKLMKMTESVRKKTHPVRELSLFHQPDEAEPFRLVKRIPFGQ